MATSDRTAAGAGAATAEWARRRTSGRWPRARGGRWAGGSGGLGGGGDVEWIGRYWCWVW
jgi:hypothetical protein